MVMFKVIYETAIRAKAETVYDVITDVENYSKWNPWNVRSEGGPAVEGETKGQYVANEKNCAAPGAVRRTGNLPFNVNSGVHAADDVVLTAMGPGADMFRGRMDNTRVFRVMTTALGLTPPASQ